MRTTINLDDDVMAMIRRLAHADDRSLGEVASDLVRQGIEARLAVRRARGVPVFAVPPGTRPLSLEVIKREDPEW